ncbi:MAG: SBBP repeat-containing protein [Candidatus Heimdallarchaeota archaeon]
MRLGKKLLTISIVTVLLVTMYISINEQFLVEANDENNFQDKVFNANAFRTEQMNFSSYFGGSGDEQYSDAADVGRCDMILDSDDNIIIVGRTSSTDLAVVNAYQDTYNGGSHDVYVVKLSPDGQTVLFCTYLGGSGAEWATCVTIDNDDNIIVGGTTTSTNFPTLNPYQGSNLGGAFYNCDAFVVKFNTSGHLQYSTFLGGTGDDWCYGIDVDSIGRIAITGSTLSTDFPMDEAFQDTHTGTGVDYFITMFTSNGLATRFSTYLGGSESDAGSSLTYDNEGNVLVTGITVSTTSYPLVNAYDDSYNGGSWDNCVAKFYNNGTIIFSTFIGGAGYDQAYDIITDSENNILIVGSTTSNNYPTVEELQGSLNGAMDAIISKLSSDGQTLMFSSYIGGSGAEESYGVIVDQQDQIILSGLTSSQDLTLESAYQTTYGGGETDAFITRLDENYQLNYTTYLGGSDIDEGQRIDCTSDGNIVTYGYTQSDDFPTEEAYQNSLSGSSDVFIAKFNLDLYVVSKGEPTVLNGFTIINPLGVIFLVGALFTFIKRRHRNR